MADPRWNVLYWGSSWIVVTVCRGAVGCEWGQPLFILGLLMLAISLECFLSLPCGPSTNIDCFVYVKHIIWRTQTIFLQLIKCRFKTWVRFVGQIVIMLENLSFEVFFSCSFYVLFVVTYANMLVDTQWPLKRAPHLQRPVWYGGLEAHWSYLRHGPLDGIFYSPKHGTLGRRNFNLTLHRKDDGEPWERFLEFRPMRVKI